MSLFVNVYNNNNTILVYLVYNANIMWTVKYKLIIFFLLLSYSWFLWPTLFCIRQNHKPSSGWYWFFMAAI